MATRPAGQIITFYSYKGGTGRTMALANLACLLSSDNDSIPARSQRVLAIDWDFEAPGLHRYLQPYLTTTANERFRNSPGCLELFEELGSNRFHYTPDDFVGNRQKTRSSLEGFNLEDYLLETKYKGLYLMKAGRFDADYARRASTFDWDDFFRRTVGLFSGVADFLRSHFDYVLVDSRTGITDTSGICTMLLPDKLVVVFTPNQQSLTGIESLVRKAISYRKSSPDGRPLTVFPLPSRVEMARPQLLEAWRNGIVKDSSLAAVLPPHISGYQPTFEALFKQIYSQSKVSLEEYFNEVMLQHIPDYAYGEPIAVALESNDSRISLSRSYTAFRDRLVELDVPWLSLQSARMERDIVQRCAVIDAKLQDGSFEDAIQLAFALLEHKPTGTLFERTSIAILKVARAAYSLNPTAASTLIRQATQRALGDKDIDPLTLAQILFDAGILSQEYRDLSLAIELLDSSSNLFSSFVGEDHPTYLIVLDQLASAFHDRGEFAKAKEIHERVLSIRQRVLGEENPDTLRSMRGLASVLQVQGDLAGAEALMRKVLAINEKQLGSVHLEIARDLSHLAKVLLEAGELTEAETLIRRALAIDEERLGGDHPNVAGNLSNLAQLLVATRRLAEAEPLMRHALAIEEKSFGPEHPNVALHLSNLAQLLIANNRLHEAEPLLRQALVIDEKSFGDKHPNVARDLSNLSQLLLATNRLAEAEPLLRRALIIDEASFGDNHPNVARTLGNLANLLVATNRPEEAKPLIERALAIDMDSLGSEHPNVARDLNNLAQILMATHRMQEAEPMLRCALMVFRNSLGDTHQDTLQTMALLASLLMKQGNLEEARKVQEEAFQLSKELLGEEHPGTLASMNKLAVIARAQGCLEEARQIGEKTLESRINILGEAHPSTLESMRELGNTLKQLGETEKALELLTRTVDLQAKGQTSA